MCNPLGSVTFVDLYLRNSVQVGVLVGPDHYFSFVISWICVRGETAGSLVAVSEPAESSSGYTSSMLTIVENSEVTASLKRFWELGYMGITKAGSPTMSLKC